MDKQSPVQRIWELGKDEHGRLIAAVILAVIGVVCGMAPYFAAAKIIALLLAGEKALSAYAPWLLAALAGYLLRTALYNSALSISHKATFSILKTIRELLMAKLPRLPLGTVMDTASDKLKQIIVDQVDGMETTLAHLFPEMTANITAPVLTLIYLFILDWRLALLALVVFPVAFGFMMSVMGGYAKDYAGAVQATSGMSSAVIEYIHGIEVIKAFTGQKLLRAPDGQGARQRAVLLRLDAPQPAGHVDGVCVLPGADAHHPTGGMAVLHTRNAHRGNIPYGGAAGVGDGCADCGGVQLRGHPGAGRHDGGAGGRNPERGRAGA